MSGFNASGFSALARRECGNYWFEPRNALLVGLANKFFPDAKSYLELGCGTGFVLRAFSRARRWERIVGAELFREGLDHARQRVSAAVELIQLDASNLRSVGEYDLIGAYDVLEHIDDDRLVMRQVFNALVPTGGLIVTVPQHPSLWSAADDAGRHVRRYCRGELERKLQAAGFTILFSTSYVVFLLPLLIASRARKDGNPDKLIAREFDIAPSLNAFLRAVLSVEVAATLRGLRWPVGGSRVVVAQKP